MRKMIQSRRPGALLALVVAYALALQALMASVGLGMSAAAASGNDGFALCVHAPDSRTTDDRKLPNPAPRCPFCFVAAQSSCDVAAVDGAPLLPAYAGLLIAGRLAGDGGTTFVPQFRRTVGAPRGPPVFSI
jgi:hypothetical protein